MTFLLRQEVFEILSLCIRFITVAKQPQCCSFVCCGVKAYLYKSQAHHHITVANCLNKMKETVSFGQLELEF